MSEARPTLRSVVARLAPLVLGAAALPLLAPTCGGFEPGIKTFSKGSIIIPMDVCYQCSLDADAATSPGSTTTNGCDAGTYSTPTYNTSTGEFHGFHESGEPARTCPQNRDRGDVVKAYGLVYQLIRNGVPVHWVINSTKAHLDDYDLSVQYNGGAPVQFYNWAQGGTLASPLPTSGNVVRYMGSAFVIDGSDFAKANDFLQGKVDPTCVDGATPCARNKDPFADVRDGSGNITIYGVNLHVTNVAFQADVARSMAGGWSAGGATPPKLALLDIASSGAGTKNSYIVIAGYLQKAGLTSDVNNPWPLGGTTAANNHGQIYDRLTMEDFIPSTPGDWKTTKLYQNGYSALWVPHWVASGSCMTCEDSRGLEISCSNCGKSCTCTAEYPAATIATALETIGKFVTDVTDVDAVTPGIQPAGLKDLFAECAGLGSFEGALASDSTHHALYNAPAEIEAAQAATHFQTNSPFGFDMTEGTPQDPIFNLTQLAVPLMQIGDFEFLPRSGAIATYTQESPSNYKSETVRLVSEYPSGAADVFTYVPKKLSTPKQAGDHGMVVYMGGHSYSGTDGTYHTAGTRLVLNTLFNLGAACSDSGVPCTTGAFGVCSVGEMKCDDNGDAYCEQTGVETTETCNGLDDDCDGLVDEDVTQECYTGPTGTDANRPCRKGIRQCELKSDGTFGFGACLGEVLPTTEVCDNVDNDCDGVVDDGLATRPCYTGAPSTVDPATGQPRGECRQGTQACSGGAWGTCTGQTLPVAAECDPDTNAGDAKDNNCNGLVDEGCGCTALDPTACYTGPSSTLNLSGEPMGNCAVGARSCVSGQWTACTGDTLPGPEDCLGKPTEDNNCNGVPAQDEPECKVCIDQPCFDGPEDALYPGMLPKGQCRAGVRECADGVYGACINQLLPSPELCDGLDNDCDARVDQVFDELTGTWGPVDCGPGLACVNGACVRASCDLEKFCPDQWGYECDMTNGSPTQWTCVPIGCPTDPCPAGQRCEGGACVNPCPAGLCAAGSTCSAGACTGGACYEGGVCEADEICRNGGCIHDPCYGVTCPNGTFCREGDCVQSCATVTCQEGQLCGADGFCKADPCHGVSCPADKVCSEGHCITDACAQYPACGTGKTCANYACGTNLICARCVDDPAATVACPSGVALARPSNDCASEPCLRAQCFSTSNRSGEGTVEPAKEAASGCGCGTGAPSPAALLVGLLALPLARRRRRPLPLLPVLLVAGLGGLLAGCPGKEDKTSGQDCGTEACNPNALVAPYITSISPPSGQKGAPMAVEVTFSGNRITEGATVRVDPPTTELSVGEVRWDTATSSLKASLDLTGAARKDYLLRVVSADRVISNTVTFGADFAVPTLDSLAPTTIDPEAQATWDLVATGGAFTAASRCMVQVGDYAIALPTTLRLTGLPGGKLPGQVLDCTLDTSRVSAGKTTFWISNEGDVDGEYASATKELQVLGTLVLSAISPPSAVEGSTVTVTAYGSGFDSTCRIRYDGAEAGIVTQFVDPTRLQANVAVGAAGAHELRVRRPATATAAEVITPAVTLTVVAAGSTTVQIDSVQPQQANRGASSVTLTLTGSGIPADARVQLLKPGAALFTDASSSSVSGYVSVPVPGYTTANGTFNFSDTAAWPAGDYWVRLAWTGGESASFSVPFKLVSNTATIWAFSTTSQKQGTTATVTVEGSNFFQTTAKPRICLLVPGATARCVDATGSTSPISGSGLSLADLNTGLYQLVVRNPPDFADSNPLTFSVLAGQPTFTAISTTPAYTPACTVQGPTPATIRLTGTNFAKPDASGAGGTRILTCNLKLGIPYPSDSTKNLATDDCTQYLAIPTDRVNVVSDKIIDITFDTREAVPSDTYPYWVKVRNPGDTVMEAPTSPAHQPLYVKLTACP